MLKDKIGVSVEKLKQALDVLGIENLVWDLDGTLLDTRAVFVNAVVDASGILASKLDLPAEKIVELFEETIWFLRPEMGVNPAIMLLAFDILVKRVGLRNDDYQVALGRKRVADIHSKDVPCLFPDTLETIDLFNSLDRNTFLMTHAEEDWTWLKLSQTGLVGKFKKVVCFSVDNPKSLQWVQNFSSLKLNPDETLVIGDNFLADIAPVLTLGARAILIDRDHKPFGAEKYENNQLSAPGWQVKQLREIPRFLLKQAEFCSP
ncbi:MAG: HAD family hydrolase [Patescibacteria group bacterium]